MQLSPRGLPANIVHPCRQIQHAFAIAILMALSALIFPVPLRAQRSGQVQLPEGATIHRLESKEEAVTVWVMERETGRMFGALLNSTQILEVNAETGREVRRMNLPGEPKHLAITAGKLIASMPLKKQLMVIDLAINRPVTTVELDQAAVDVFTSDANEPYFYTLSGSGGNVAISKFNANDGTLVHENETEVTAPREAVKGKSAAGNSALFVVVNQNQSSLSRVYRLDPEKLTLTEAFAPGVDMQPPAFPLEISPSSRWWTYGGKLYDVSAKSSGNGYRGVPAFQSERDFETSSVTFHPKLDLVCGLDLYRCKISLRRFSDAELLSTVPFSRSTFDYQGSQELDHQLVFTLWNGTKRAVVAGPQTFIVMNLEELEVPSTGVVLIEQPAPVNAMMGQAIDIQLEIGSESESGEVTFSKVAGPDGLVVSDDGRLKWQPSDKDVGKHKIKIKATVGDASDEVEFVAQISRPEFILNGVIVDFAVNPAGTVALAGCAARSDTIDERGFSPFDVIRYSDDDPIDRLFLLDLQTMQILAEKKLNEAAACVLLTNEAVFVGHTNGSKVYRLSLDDLSELKRVFISAPPKAFAQLNDDTLFVTTTKGGVGLSSEELAEVPLPGQDGDLDYFESYQNSQGHYMTFREIAPDRFTLGSFVIDSQASIQMVTQYAFDSRIPFVYEIRRNSDYIGRILSAMSGDNDGSIGASPGYPQPWDRMANGTGVYDVTGKQISSWSGAGRILVDRPLSAVVQIEITDERTRESFDYYHGDNSRRGNLSLEIRDLVDGRTIGSYPLANVSYYTAAQAIAQKAMHIDEAGDQLIVAYDNRVFNVDLPADELADVKEPLMFAKEIRPLTAPVGEVVEIPIKTTGGQGKISYQLTLAQFGVSIDADTGVLSVDTETIWKDWLTTDDYDRAYASNYSFREGFDGAQASYAEIFGEETTEIPFRVPFEITATDEQGMSTRLSNQLVMLAPMAEWDAMVEATKEEMERERERAEEERRRMIAEREKEKANEPGSASSAEIAALADAIKDSLTKISDMSEQIGEMQAAVDEAKQATGSQQVSPQLQSKLDAVDQQLDRIQSTLDDNERDAAAQNFNSLVLFVIFSVVAMAGGAGFALMRRKA